MTTKIFDAEQFANALQQGLGSETLIHEEIARDKQKSITVWAVRTDGFGGGKVYSTDLTIQHVVMQLNFSQDVADDTTYYINENYARANLAHYISNHPANQPIKEEEE